MKKTATITVKQAKEDQIEGTLSLCASFSKSGSILGMRKKYYGKDALLLVCGSYVYNVTPFTLLHRYFEDGKPPQTMTSQEIFNQIVCPVNCKFGAPMGRNDNKIVHEQAKERFGQAFFEAIQICWDTMPHFDRKVPLDSGGYDRGGAYWGIGSPLRLRYTKDGKYWEFYRD